MIIDILTLFPPMFEGIFDYSIVKRAQDQDDLRLKIYDLRDWATNKYKSVDDKPYGGGPGMLMRIDIIDRAITNIKSQMTNQIQKLKVILLDAGGEKFTQKKAVELSKEEHLIIICGHYEGVDHRVHEHLADEIISVGDYVLSGGEIPAMILVDSITRLLPGSLGNPDSLSEESFNPSISNAKSEYAQYTRPETYKNWKVPEILLSGDHAKIKKWRSLAQ
ncbi:MAG: tRNA (guanosine(37)-N1)-methyltransferase TrmD [Patescibacteria group bacterium]